MLLDGYIPEEGIGRHYCRRRGATGAAVGRCIREVNGPGDGRWHHVVVAAVEVAVTAGSPSPDGEAMD